MDLKEQMQELYSKFGNLKRVEVYDVGFDSNFPTFVNSSTHSCLQTNPEGVITLTYDNVEASDLAVKSLDKIIRNGRQIGASLWDGKTRYQQKETKEEAQRREEAWKEFLEDEEEEDEKDDAKGETNDA